MSSANLRFAFIGILASAILLLAMFLATPAAQAAPLAQAAPDQTPEPTATIPIILPPLTVVVPVETPTPTMTLVPPTATATIQPALATPTLPIYPPGTGDNPDGPNDIPEAGTLLMLGGGLASAAGYFRLIRRRSRD